jgi:hypothetical protein
MTPQEMAKPSCNRLGYGGHEFSIHSLICACGKKDTRTMSVSEIGRKR